MNITLRPLSESDAVFLREALYLAIFVPPDAPPPPLEIVNLPELAAYITDFGAQAGDVGVLALDGDLAVGAAWARLLYGYGFVDDATPELSIAVLPAYRGQGIGVRMMEALFAALRPSAARVSLSVQAANPALRLYERLGFVVVAQDGESVVMVREL
jgi:ribosomal protein S18 acetylase RimI-like enzyme